MRYAFIDAHRQEFDVQVMCHVLHVSRSGYYAWRKRPPSAREMADRQFVEEMQAIHKSTRQTYGYERMWRTLQQREFACGKHRTRRLMRTHGLVTRQRRSYKRTTRANPAHPTAANILAADFVAERPNQKWCADITYIPTQAGWLYLAAVVDLFSRRIVGWSMSDRMTQTLVSDAFSMAWAQRRPAAGLLHHSDRGSQYTSQPFQQLLADCLAQCSMSRRGNCYDNAVMESFFGKLKTELVHHTVYHTRTEAMTDIFWYIEGFYNRTRLHSALGFMSPTAFEQAHLAKQSFRVH